MNPKPSELAERFHFQKRLWEKDETGAQYMVALRKLALACNFQKLRKMQ